MENNKDLNYVNNLLEESQLNGYPAIYAMWGVIVLIGFIVIDIKVEWANAYWIGSSIAGFIASMVLGSRAESKSGQRDKQQGKRYSAHFGIMGICIFIAIFAKDYQAILLITGLGYCLAGLYLERIMLVVGMIAIACYIGVVSSIITSSSIVGIVFASGLFASAWATSRMNAKAQ